VAAVPFHIVAPDVYDGSPTPVTGYMATAVKAAAFAALLRSWAKRSAVAVWHQIVCVARGRDHVRGNLVALAQRTVSACSQYCDRARRVPARRRGRRDERRLGAFLFYLVAYTLTTLAAFALPRGPRDGRVSATADRRPRGGLVDRRPWLAFRARGVHAVAAGLPRDGGIHRQVVHPARGHRRGAAPARRDPRPYERHLAGYYLPVIYGDVHDPSRSSRPTRTCASVGGRAPRWRCRSPACLLLGVRPNRLLDLAKTSGDGLGAPRGHRRVPPLQTSTGR